MHKYQSFDAWKRAHQCVLVVFRATDAAWHPRARALFDQLKRATLSVEANFVEGYALGTPALFRRHLRIAMGSAAEAECLARIAGELSYLAEANVGQIEELLGGTMRVLHGLLGRPTRTTPSSSPQRTTPHSPRSS